jgi:hypothetical protein
MYKQDKKTCLEPSKQPLLWLKRKLIIIITAFMVGLSNGMNEGDKNRYSNQNNTEQQDKKD